MMVRVVYRATGWVVILAAWSFLLGIVACGPTAEIPTQEPDASGLNVLYFTEGDVRIKRESWGEFRKTSSGTVVHRGDQIDPGVNTAVRVLCDDLAVRDVPPSRSSLTNVCPPPPEPILTRQESRRASNTRSVSADIPRILSPRATMIMDSTPTLQWTAATSATDYLVRVESEALDKVVWETNTAATEIQYAGEPLQPGLAYSFAVAADTGKASTDANEPGLAFTLLPQSRIADVEEARKAIVEGKSLNNEEKGLALAYYYAGEGLIADAIRELEKLRAEGSALPAVHNLTGELYREIGLKEKAINAYEGARSLAEQVGDSEAQEIARAGLAELQ